MQLAKDQLQLAGTTKINDHSQREFLCWLRNRWESDSGISRDRGNPGLFSKFDLIFLNFFRKYSQFPNLFLNISKFTPFNLSNCNRNVRAVHNYLEFTQITSNDQGRYYCTATSPFGNSTKVAEVIVHHHEVPNRRPAQGIVGRVLEAIEGDTVSLECNQPSSEGVRVSYFLQFYMNISARKFQQFLNFHQCLVRYSLTGDAKVAKFHGLPSSTITTDWFCIVCAKKTLADIFAPETNRAEMFRKII